MGESGLLDFFINTVVSAEGLGLRLKKQSLRLVGNACAECGGFGLVLTWVVCNANSLIFVDENKAQVVQTGKLGHVILGYLDNEESLLPFVISVIYNICIENGGFCSFWHSRCW